MSPDPIPRFDPRALVDLCGDRTFARAEAYVRDGSVEILGIEPDRVVARVSGSEDYRTVVTGRAAAIGGECSCPAFQREGVCKHIAAVALAANAAGADGAEGGGTLARVRAFLGTRSVEFLVGTIMDVAERDPALLRRLEIAAAMADVATSGADGKALAVKLRKTVRDATRTRGYVEYRQVPGWAAGVHAALDMLAELAAGPRASLAVGLATDVIERIERATESLDDSDGHCGGLLLRAQEIHRDACLAARPDPVPLARDLFRRETEEQYDIFSGAASQYAEALGEAGLAEYRRLAQAAWDELPALVGPARGGAGGAAGGRFDDYRLVAILDFFAARDGDVDRRIALRAKNLSSQWAYLELAAFCVAQGRDDEALCRAEEGLWMFEDDRPDHRLVSFTVDLLSKAGRNAEAEAHLWRAFGKAPSLDLHRRLRDLGGDAAVRRVIADLRRRGADAPRPPWSHPSDLLAEVLIEEQMFDDAWGHVRAHGASRRTRDALADASESRHPEEALGVHAERVEEFVGMGGNAAYEKAAALVARMAGLRGAAEQAAYLADIKERHRRKRNFMKLLP